MSFRHVDRSMWSWCGLALTRGALPLEGKTPVRMALLRNLLELAANASDADVDAELQLFLTQGKQRG